MKTSDPYDPNIRVVELKTIDAAVRWWRAKRPLDWNIDDHLANYRVNCVGDDEHRLAYAVAQVLQNEDLKPMYETAEDAIRPLKVGKRKR